MDYVISNLTGSNRVGLFFELFGSLVSLKKNSAAGGQGDDPLRDVDARPKLVRLKEIRDRLLSTPALRRAVNDVDERSWLYSDCLRKITDTDTFIRHRTPDSLRRFIHDYIFSCIKQCSVS